MTQEDLDQISNLIGAGYRRANPQPHLAHVERRLDQLEACFTAFEFQLAGIGNRSPPANASIVKCRLPKPPATRH
jgi:hypothetical protein